MTINRRAAIVLFLLGVVVGSLLGPAAAEAQTAMRMFGTLAAGGTKAIQVTSTGAVVAKLQ